MLFPRGLTMRFVEVCSSRTRWFHKDSIISQGLDDFARTRQFRKDSMTPQGLENGVLNPRATYSNRGIGGAS